MIMTTVYTDGSCLGNPGAGGWAAIEAVSDGFRVSGGNILSTNNIMEMTAVIGALQNVPIEHQVTIVTDSKYVKDGITLWIHNWIKRNWRKADGKPVKNKELWIQLHALVQERQTPIIWRWVKAHAGDHYNEMADTLARETAEIFA
jgi:ribonuclease HI